jgi:hypothetical protein
MKIEGVNKNGPSPMLGSAVPSPSTCTMVEEEQSSSLQFTATTAELQQQPPPYRMVLLRQEWEFRKWQSTIRIVIIIIIIIINAIRLIHLSTTTTP